MANEADETLFAVYSVNVRASRCLVVNDGLNHVIEACRKYEDIVEEGVKLCKSLYERTSAWALGLLPLRSYCLWCFLVALRFLITFMVLGHVLINSIAAFHYVADLDHHGGEGFHLHADQQLFVGLSDDVDKNHDDQPEQSNPSVLSSDGLFPVELADDEHDDGSHVHLQLESMLAGVSLYYVDSLNLQELPRLSYHSQAFSPPVPPPTV